MPNDTELDLSKLENVKELSGGSIRAGCPACIAAGSDSGKDHLLIQPSGKFGCAAHAGDRGHRAEIFKLASKIPNGASLNGNGHSKGSPRIVETYPYHDAVGKLLFEVVRFEPKDFRQRRPDKTALDGFTWNLKGVRRVPYRLPELIAAVSKGTPVYIAEGEKDCDALAQAGFVATCNSGGAGKWDSGFPEYFKGADICVIADRDEPGKKHAESVAASLHPVAASVRVIELPGDGVKDAHDFFRAGGQAAELDEIAQAAPLWTPAKDENALTIRTPDELLAMEFDDGDRILGDRLLAYGQSLVIAGQGGLGKSRLLLQFVTACRAGLPFIGFETRGQEMKWLVLQAENSNRRLQKDLAALRDWIGEKHWPQVSAGIYIHTLETDADNFLSLDNERTQAGIRALIEKLKPDGVAWDSLYNFGAGNLSSDEDMTATLLAIARLSKAGDQKRAIVVLHHALTGKSGIAKVQGFDRASFGRNSKVLHQWARGQINVAPGLPDSNDVLVLTCGKCSNGKEFPPFAVRLNPETMIYAVDESFDLSAWRTEVTGKSDAPDLSPKFIAGIVAEVSKATGEPTKKQLAKAIKDETACARGSAYRAIERAERAKAIHHIKTTKTYVKT